MTFSVVVRETCSSTRPRPAASAARLIDALEAGGESGGDRRETDARSAAIKVVDSGAPVADEWYNDLSGLSRCSQWGSAKE